MQSLYCTCTLPEIKFFYCGFIFIELLDSRLSQNFWLMLYIQKCKCLQPVGAQHVKHSHFNITEFWGRSDKNISWIKFSTPQHLKHRKHLQVKHEIKSGFKKDFWYTWDHNLSHLTLVHIVHVCKHKQQKQTTSLRWFTQCCNTRIEPKVAACTQWITLYQSASSVMDSQAHTTRVNDA